MAKKKTGTVEVFLNKEFFNSMVSLLSAFIEADESNKYGVYASRLKEKIMTYSRTFTHNETENTATYFYEDEAAMLIKLCAIYVSATDDPSEDFFQQLIDRRKRSNEI